MTYECVILPHPPRAPSVTELKFSQVDLTITMPKKCNWSVYKKHYNSKWETEPMLKDWVRSCPGDTTKAACRFCNGTIRAHHSDLVKHANSDTHKKYAEGRASNAARFLVDSMSSSSKETETNQKVTDLKMAVCIACHTSISAVDHIGEVICVCAKNCNCSKNTLRTLQLHRTKCSNLIKNILGPELQKQLIEDIGSSEYSLIIDESTDISDCKQLCMVVRYFSDKKNEMVSTFLGMVVLEGTSANAQVGYFT